VIQICSSQAKCFFLQRYDCTKSTAWSANKAVPVSGTGAVPYPKGNLQVWHLYAEGFTNQGDISKVIDLPQQNAAVKVKKERFKAEEAQPEQPLPAKKKRVLAKATVKQEPGASPAKKAKR